jgi:hypothetical protein
MVCLFKKNACQRHLDAWVLVVGWARFNKRTDTVGELKSADICVSHMPSLKAKKLGKLPREKVLLEL